MATSNNVCQDSEQPSRDVAGSLRSKLQNVSSQASKHSIYRVPERLQYANAQAYNPQIVSIGPIHHGEPELQNMQDDKMIYLKSFLDRTKESLETFVEFVREREQKVRGCYAETFPMISSDDFVEMIVLDAAFVIELLCKNYFRKEIDKNDCVFHKPLKLTDVREDLMLLQNQLPFFILRDIFPKMKIKISDPCNDDVALIKIVYKFFHAKAYLGEEQKVLEKIRDLEINHFVDFFRHCHIPTKKPTERKIETLNLPNVTALYQAGVKFKGSKGSLLDIHFCQGTLVIPQLQIRKSTESFLLNMLAFEQCHSFEYYINDYMFLLDRLIDNTRDVELLVRSKVIESKLPDSQEVVTLMNNLVRGSVLRRNHFNFKDLCNGLNAHCSNPWNTWMATLKRDYFSSPLTIFAVGVASAIFFLTFIQTLCSCGVQFEKSKNPKN